MIDCAVFGLAREGQGILLTLLLLCGWYLHCIALPLGNALYNHGGEHSRGISIILLRQGVVEVAL